MMTTPGSPLRRDRVLVQRLDDELVLLDVDSGTYFALNDVGARVWELCDGDHVLDGIVDVICSEFDAPRSVVHGDVQALLDELRADGLLEP